VSEVAQAVGMSLTYFGRVYRAAYGHPPSQDLDG
jgi:AraC-like DNA-binding protein